MSRANVNITPCKKYSPLNSHFIRDLKIKKAYLSGERTRKKYLDTALKRNLSLIHVQLMHGSTTT